MILDQIMHTHIKIEFSFHISLYYLHYNHIPNGLMRISNPSRNQMKNLSDQSYFIHRFDSNKQKHIGSIELFAMMTVLCVNNKCSMNFCRRVYFNSRMTFPFNNRIKYVSLK